MENDVKEVARRYFEEVHTRRKADFVAELFASGLVDQARTVVGMAQRAFPDYRITIRHQIAEGDIVAAAWTLEGSHEGEWASPMGAVSPTGKRIGYTGSTMFRVSEGKIVEVLATNHDHLGLLQQMDALPALAPRPGA